MKTFAKKMTTVIIVILCNFSLYSQIDKQVVISADKMKILFIGIDNPVSVAVQGKSSANQKISMTNGIITGSKGNYIAKPGHDAISIIEVTAEIEPGKIKKIGCDTFRVVRIPDPIPQIGDVNNGLISKEYIINNPVMNAYLNLPLDIKFEILSYDFSYSGKDPYTLSVHGVNNKITQEIIATIII